MVGSSQNLKYISAKAFCKLNFNIGLKPDAIDRIFIKIKKMNKNLNIKEIDRIIEMAWEDRTPFEAIQFQFGISESEVIELMRSELKESSFKLWRKRVNSGVSKKHLKKRSEEIDRFKCSRQRIISNNKISKR